MTQTATNRMQHPPNRCRLYPLALLWTLLLSASPARAEEAKGAELVFPEYDTPRVIYDIFLDHPGKLGSALHWIRALINPLMDSPYDMAPEFMDIHVLIHGTEVVTLVRANEERYKEEVERMRYYDSLGVHFKICGMAAQDYGYQPSDFQDFVQIVPSAFTELAHWQQQGYALITPKVELRTHSVEEMR